MAGVSTSQWTAAQVALIDGAALPQAPLIGPDDAQPLIPGLDLWDMWPVQDRDGSVSSIVGGDLWMALSAPDMGDPGLRHFHGRIRLLHRYGQRWRDLGNALPDGFGPGNREWAGSAVRDGDFVTLHYTAAGLAGAEGGYQQRLFATTGRLGADGSLSEWSEPVETVRAGGDYLPADQQQGEPGKIWAFRDPAHFRDPADGADYLLFTASLAASKSDWRGAVGIARGDGAGGWTMLPPLVHADGLNNELERPHVLHRDGLYYLFWSTQRSVFAEGGPRGPNGLYGMAAKSLFGPWRPLNGTGLVLANPLAEPSQAYSWWVLPSLEVLSFVDHWGLKGRAVDAGNARETFGGTPAPWLRIAIEGDTTSLLGEAALA